MTTCLELLRTITTAHHALLMVKNIDAFPGDDARMTGVIDIWWIISDGGILVMLAFLLTHHKVWRACSIRLFSVARILNLVRFVFICRLIMFV